MNTENHGISADEKRDLLASRHPEELQHQADVELIGDDTPPVIDEFQNEIPSNRPRALTGDEIGEMLDSLASIAELCESLAALVPMMLAGMQGAGKASATPTGLMKRRG